MAWKHSRARMHSYQDGGSIIEMENVIDQLRRELQYERNLTRNV